MSNEPDHSDGLEKSRREILDAVGSDSTETNTGRRNVLRGAAATVLATVGFTNTAAAIDPTGRVELELVERRYGSFDAKRRAVQRHGQDLLDLLAEREYLDAADVDELTTDRLTVAGRRVDGTATAKISTTETVDGGEVFVSVEPEVGRSYAFVEEDGETIILDPQADGDEINTSNCYTGTVCFEGSDCASGCANVELRCCSDDCYTGDYQDCCDSSCQSSCSTACGY